MFVCRKFLFFCVAVLCLDRGGYIAAGVSTSGPPFKPPGRVGDSPLPGCGLYADDRVSATKAYKPLVLLSDTTKLMCFPFC